MTALANILIALIGAASGGGVMYIINFRQNKMRAKAESAMKTHEHLQFIENLAIERIEMLVSELDKKNELFITQKSETMDLKVLVKELEEKIKLLEKEFEILKHKNEILECENSKMKEKITKLINE